MWQSTRRIEEFLASNTGFYGDTKFDPTWDRGTKNQWLIDNASEAKRLAFKMRGVGIKTWNEYLEDCGLEEYTGIRPK